MRRKHGLAPDQTTILVSTGDLDVGVVETLIHTIRELQHPSQLGVTCGRSAALNRRRRPATAPDPALHVVGYATETDEYIAAADLLVAKPWDLTSSEALARGLVLVVVHPSPARRNADHLLEPAWRFAATTSGRSPGRSTGSSRNRHAPLRRARTPGASRAPRDSGHHDDADRGRIEPLTALVRRRRRRR